MKQLFKTHLLLLVALLCCALQSVAADFSGSGTAKDPYLISNLTDLKTFSKKVYDGTSYEGKYFKQTADIVVNENVIKSDGTFNEADKSKFTNWVPAGQKWWTWTDNYFLGNYDGGGHSISGLYFGEDMDEVLIGLFGQVGGSILQNINIKDSYMGCKSAGSFNQLYNNHGFLVGRASGSTIINCHVENSVIDATPEYQLFTGGLIGAIGVTHTITTTVKNCSFSGTINVKSKEALCRVSGLIGELTASNGKIVLENCTTKGNLNLTIDHGFESENTGLSGLCWYNPIAQVCHVHIIDCANYMDINVESVGYGEQIGPQGRYEENLINTYKHMKRLRIYTLCGAVESMTNCANFGDVKLGNIHYEDYNYEPYATLYAIDDLTVAPVGSIFGNLKSCAFYGTTSYGQNWYDYDEPYAGRQGTIYLYEPKIYTVAEDIRSGATISRVLRLENDKDDIGNDYLQDRNSVPDGVKLYTTLDKILDDAGNIVAAYNGYDATEKVVYNWGLFADGTYRGCPAPSIYSGTKSALVGEGTTDNPYLIQDEMDYKSFVASINSGVLKSGVFQLLADIDMSNSGAVDAIGTNQFPFKGTFDGNGHAIIGLNAKSGSMFGVINSGTVKNLTLLNMTCDGVDECFPLANKFTFDNTQQGFIDNCYVGGKINVKFNDSNTTSDRYVAGLCGTCDGANIRNCYFKGTFNLDGAGKSVNAHVAGFCKNITNERKTTTVITNSYSIFNANFTNGCSKGNVYGVAISDNEKFENTLLSTTGLYYMTNCSVDHASQYATQASSYADIQMAPASSFIDGVYNPVLPNTKSYKLTNGKGLDAVLVDGEGSGDLANTILHYVPADGENYENDLYLWQHPNIAVYNKTDDAEYLINCNLDPTKDLQLNMDDAESQTIKANMHYPLSIYHNYTDRPLTKLLCLPVVVQRDALPAGSKLKIVGKKVLNADDKTFISTMVECDSVPAGVPFLVEIPADKTSSDKNTTYDLVMRGKVAPEPVYTISVGDISMETELKGTFAGFTKKRTSDQFHKYREDCGVLDDGRYRVDDFANTVSPFQAYAEVEEPSRGYTYYYYLVDNLLLDEESTDVTSMLNTYNGKTIGVVLKRAMNKNVWNTVCLPFSLSADEISAAFGEGTQVEQLARVEKATGDEGATLRFEAVTTGMEAGKTYLVKPANSGTLYNFADKAITNELASDPADTYYTTYFKGTFAPTMLQGADEQTANYNYFIQSNKLYYLPEGQAVPMKGFRGWILIASNSLFGDGQATAAKLVHFDGSTTGIRAVEYGKTSDGTRIYNLQGIETGEPSAPGVYIKNGKKYVKK